MTDRCLVCGKTGCPSADDPQSGPMVRHNQAAYTDLLRRRQTPPAEKDAV